MSNQGQRMGMGCIVSLVGGIISICIAGGVMGYVFWMSNRAMDQAAAASGQQNFFNPMGMPTPGMQAGGGTWDGVNTFNCAGNDNVTLTGMTVTLAVTPAISAAGNCQLTLVGMNITAPVVIDASGNAHVTITGGSLTGTSGVAVNASGLANITAAGATVMGTTSRSGMATVVGLP